MTVVEDAAAAIAVLALLGAALLAMLVARRRFLTRDGGAVDCAVRLGGRSWAPGVARFGSHQVEWWKVLSLSFRPHLRWERATFNVLDRRWPDGSAAVEVHGPVVLLRCDSAGTLLDVSLSSDAYTGLASWLEAAPPGPTTTMP